MYIVSVFTESGVPKLGLTPTIRIRDLSDNSLVITDAVMSEVGDGEYKYYFTAYDSTVDYAIRSDGGISLNDSDRYKFAGNESYIDDISQSVWSTPISAYAGKNVTGAIQTLVYGNCVNVSTSGASGTSWPIGTLRFPVSNITDGVAIARTRGIKEIDIHNDLTIPTGLDASNLSFRSIGIMDTDVTLEANANVANSAFRYLNMHGELSNGDSCLFEACTVYNFDNFTGVMNNVAFGQGSEISFGSWAEIIQGTAGGEPTNEPEFNLQNASVNMSHITGNIKLIGKTGSNRTVINCNSANLIIDATCVAGIIQLLGVGAVEADNSGAGCTVDIDGFITTDTISDHVWDEQTADHTIDGSYGAELATKADIAAASSTSTSAAISGSVIYGTQDSGTYITTNIKDNTYWEIEEDAVDGLTAELIFNIPDEDRAGVFRVFGRYEGLPGLTHYMELWVYNYEASAWEQLLEEFLPGGNTTDAEYEHEYFERNIDRTNNNEVKFRLIHNVTTYNIAHHMFLDFAEITSIEVITAADIAEAVWAEEEARRVLGLLDENSYLDNQVYNGDSLLTSARKRIYSVAGSVGTASNVIATYNITATWSGTELTSYKMQKV